MAGASRNLQLAIMAGVGLLLALQLLSLFTHKSSYNDVDGAAAAIGFAVVVEEELEQERQEPLEKEKKETEEEEEWFKANDDDWDEIEEEDVEKSFHTWLQKRMVTVEEYNALTILERSQLRSQFDQEKEKRKISGSAEEALAEEEEDEKMPAKNVQPRPMRKREKRQPQPSINPAASKNILDELNLRKPHYPRKPLNVVVLYPDDWRHDTLGGVRPIVRTPFLNELAEEGIRFTYNIVTTSICHVSRCTLFTGQYWSRHLCDNIKPFKLYNNWNTTWPSLLQQAGYFTGHIGKWQLSKMHSDRRLQFWNFSDLFEGKHSHGKGKNEQRNTEKAEQAFDKFLQLRPKHKPFATTIAYYPPKAVGISKEPGGQWDPMPIFKDHYRNITIPGPPYNVTESWQLLPWFLHDVRYNSDARYRYRQRFNTTIKYQEGMRNYYALVEEVDRSCRRIVQKLKDQGEYDNTLIIFTTDNGIYHAEHAMAGKWHPYQESIRVPLIIRDPRMPPKLHNTLNDEFTLNIDLAATILGAAGLKRAPGMQGRDMADLYLEKDEELDEATRDKPWRKEVFYEHMIERGPRLPQSQAMCRKDLKYMYWPQFDYDNLYNLTEDPYELHDVAKDPQYKDVLEELRARKKYWEEAVK